jgi:hypothetical protein
MPSNPDVRVRLSAEGVAEVVNAFKRVQNEAEKSKSGFNKLMGAAGSLKTLLPALTVGAVVTGFIALTKQSLDLADGLGKLNQKTGISVETLSTLSFAARTADVEQEALNKGLIKFTRAMDDYDKGASSAKDAVRGLFGDSKALADLNQDERLLKVVDALAKLEPGAKRTGTAIAMFGKSGADLLPLIDDLGSGGFDELRKKAEKLGLVIDADLAQKAQQANDAMTDLKSAAQGLATRFASGLAPALADVADALVEGIAGDGVDGFQLLGEWAGKVLKGIIVLVALVAGGIAKIVQRTTSLFTSSFQLLNDLVHGRFTGAWERFKTKIVTEADAMDATLEAKYTKVLSALSGNTDRKKPKARTKRDTSASTDTGAADRAQKEADRVRKAEMELIEAQADAEARIAAMKAKEQEAAEKEKYEKGLTSLQEYYAQRIKITQQAGDAETRALYDKLVGLQTAPLGKDELQEERQAKIVKAAADYQVKIIENAAAVKALQADQAKEEDTLQQKALEFERKILEAQGDRFAAARAGIDAEAAQLDELLRKQGVADEQRAQRVQSFRESGYQQIDFDELQSNANGALDALDRAYTQIEQKVQSGQLYAFQGEQEILQLEKERLPLLQQIADAMRAAAITPEQIQAAEEFQDRIEQLSVSTNKAGMEMANLKADVSGALEGDLSNYLSSGIDQAESFGDAWRGAAASIVASLRQIAAQMLATLIIQKMLGLIGMGVAGGSGGTSSMSANTGSLSVATGGLIRGPGTGTSDSIPARLSNYEYVIRAAAVKQPGMLEHLNMINFGTPQVRRRTVSRFADGGLVDIPAAGGVKNADMAITLGLDPELTLKKLVAHPAWTRAVIRTLGDNKKSANQVLTR